MELAEKSSKSSWSRVCLQLIISQLTTQTCRAFDIKNCAPNLNAHSMKKWSFIDIMTSLNTAFWNLSYSTKKHFGQNPPHTVLPNRMLDDIFRNAYICEENCTWRSWTEKVKSSQHEKQNFKTKIKKKISKVYFLNCELLCVKQWSSHKGPRFQPCSKVWGNTWASIRSVIKFYDYNHAQIHHFTAQFPVSDT